MRMYEEMGTQLALQYGGSQAVGTPNSNAARDFLQSVKVSIAQYSSVSLPISSHYDSLFLPFVRPCHSVSTETHSRISRNNILWMCSSAYSSLRPLHHKFGILTPLCISITSRRGACTSHFTMMSYLRGIGCAVITARVHIDSKAALHKCHIGSPLDPLKHGAPFLLCVRKKCRRQRDGHASSRRSTHQSLGRRSTTS